MTTNSLSRTVGLARWNAVLLTRNRLAMLYGVVMPLAPMASCSAASAATAARVRRAIVSR